MANRKKFRLWEVLADPDARRPGRDRAEAAADLRRRIGLRVPRIELTRTAPHEDQQARFRRPNPSGPAATARFRNSSGKPSPVIASAPARRHLAATDPAAGTRGIRFPGSSLDCPSRRPRNSTFDQQFLYRNFTLREGGPSTNLEILPNRTPAATLVPFHPDDSPCSDFRNVRQLSVNDTPRISLCSEMTCP